jgi:putative FmdB family regulatory protein
MPTYDYECSSCGHAFEAFQSMSDAPLSSCPECGKAVRRLIGGGMGIIFKGSGFYKNDSRSSSKTPASKAAASKDGASKDGASKEAGAKSDAAPATGAASDAGASCAGCAAASTGSCPAA